jgi:hypothetical protein
MDPHAEFDRVGHLELTGAFVRGHVAAVEELGRPFAWNATHLSRRLGGSWTCSPATTPARASLARATKESVKAQPARVGR